MPDKLKKLLAEQMLNLAAMKDPVFGKCRMASSKALTAGGVTELLNEAVFRNLAYARIVIAAWPADYNTERPHSALDYQTPVTMRGPTTAIARPAARDDNSERRAIGQSAPR